MGIDMRSIVLALALMLLSPVAAAGGGPLGIDHVVRYDNSGIWKRSTQKDLIYATVATVIGGSLAFGDNDRIGDTFWRSLDAVAAAGAGAQLMKWTFQRERPSQTSDPNRFFSGIHNASFPSGEVAAVTGAVTPFIATYGREHPAVWLLALLPAYDAIARVKVHGHWQSDVVVGAALGAGVGVWASRRESPLIVGWLPGGFSVGYVHRF